MIGFLEVNLSKMRSNDMKRIVIFVLCPVLIAIGCAPPLQYVHLRKTPTSVLMANITDDRAKSASYSFESKLPDPFQFKDILIDLNTSYASNLKYYMGSRFTVAADGTGSCKIDVTLVSCEIETADAGLQTVASGSTVQRLTVTTRITIGVRVEADGKVTEEEITATGEVTGNMFSLSTGQASISIALEGSILLMDRFLNKVFGNEVEGEPVGGVNQSDI
jgi:hypothetical protein